MAARMLLSSSRFLLARMWVPTCTDQSHDEKNNLRTSLKHKTLMNEVAFPSHVSERTKSSLPAALFPADINNKRRHVLLRLGTQLRETLQEGIKPNHPDDGPTFRTTKTIFEMLRCDWFAGESNYPITASAEARLLLDLFSVSIIVSSYWIKNLAYKF